MNGKGHTGQAIGHRRRATATVATQGSKQQQAAPVPVFSLTERASRPAAPHTCTHKACACHHALTALAALALGLLLPLALAERPTRARLPHQLAWVRVRVGHVWRVRKNRLKALMSASELLGALAFGGLALLALLFVATMAHR